jgi:hypothetical protein
MTVEGAEIREAFENPESIYWSPKYGNTVMVRGRIALCVDHNAYGVSTVVTIIWATPDEYANDMQHGEYAGRTVQDLSGWRAARERSRA